MKVTVYLNEGPGRFFPYEPDTAHLINKGTYEFEVTNTESDYWHIPVLESVFRLFNIGSPEDPRVQEYRDERRSRSLSVGDVVVLGEVAFAVGRFDWVKISTDDFRRGLEVPV